MGKTQQSLDRREIAAVNGIMLDAKFNLLLVFLIAFRTFYYYAISSPSSRIEIPNIFNIRRGIQCSPSRSLGNTEEAGRFCRARTDQPRQCDGGLVVVFKIAQKIDIFSLRLLALWLCIRRGWAQRTLAPTVCRLHRAYLI
ncbi:hypothetical protein L209DRAFT_458844 [Thermothelomyces heterothallicus CBS 203.75]